MSGLFALQVRSLNARGFLFDDGLLIAVLGVVIDRSPLILCLFGNFAFIFKETAILVLAEC